jgi:glycosyltransferase involved in cell wall biosynthesis
VKVLWHSNAPWAASGYGVQTKHAIRILRGLGHEVAVSAMFGLDGDVLNMDGVLIIPGNGQGDPYGVQRVVSIAKDWQADVAITLLDAWVFRPDWFDQAGVRWVPITPIDHEPAPGEVRDRVEHAWCGAGMTAGGQAEIATWDVPRPPVYFPHCYDPDVYRVLPDDQVAAWRERHKIGPDTFVVAMVAANKGTPSRKNIPVAIEAFRGLLDVHPDSVLVLHTEMDRRMQGINVYETLAFFGIPEDRVRYSDQQRPAKPESVAMLMNAADVLVNPAMGEGYGVPILEAAACGTPAIVGGWTAMPEVAGPGGILLPRVDAMRWCTLQCSFQFMPSPWSVLEGMRQALAERGTPDWEARRQQCLTHAAASTVDAVTPIWRESMDKLARYMEADAAPAEPVELPAPVVE